MTKVLIATEKPFAQAATLQIKDVFNNAGYKIVMLEKYSEKAAFINAVKDVDALIVRSDNTDKEIIEASENLKIIVRAGAGYDNIDLKAATDKNIVVMNTPGQNSNAVAELAIGLMIYQARKQFNGASGTELKGKKIGIHAYGNVGKYVAKIAQGFGMEIFAFDPFIPNEIIEKDGVTVVNSAQKLYAECNYISLHIPANEHTKESINYDLMIQMPKNPTLINTARKEVICENSLKKIFSQREDFNYISDIAPDCANELKEKYTSRCFFTPKKMGAQTAEANINAGIAAANQIVNFFEKGENTFKVN